MLQQEHERISGESIAMPIGDLRALEMVEKNPSIILRDIREALGMPHSTLTSVIDRLEGRGLVRRTITERDRRSYGLELTKRGRAFRARHDRADHELAIQLLRVLGSAEDRRTFLDALARVIGEFE